MITGVYIAEFLCMFVMPFVLTWVRLPLMLRRRIYWYCTCFASLLAIPAAYPDVDKGLGLGAFVLFVMVWVAFFYTPYIRIGGRIYALHADDINAESDDPANSSHTTTDDGSKLSPYEQITTTPKIWWVIAGFSLAIGVAVGSSFLPGHDRLNFQHDRELITLMLAFCLLSSVGFGYGEAKFGYPIAQRQRLQFIIASISSAGLFAALYLTSYYLTARAYARHRGE